MALVKPNYELADVVRCFGKQLVKHRSLSSTKLKALQDITQCRTATLGGHEEQCNCCNKKRYSYNSCGNRHCPKCLASKQAVWIDRLMQQSLEVKHFHIVFTVPHLLNKICLFNERMYYNALFKAVWQTLRSFGYTHYGVETGAVAVLHTWGQNLSLHPHIHCIVPAAGYSLTGKWKTIGNSGKYLYPVHQLSAAFRGKFLYLITKQLTKSGDYSAFSDLIGQSKKKKWVVNSQAALAKPEHVIKYLGQYTHRVAIANHRIIDVSKTKVTFIAKDYRDNAKKKPVPLEGEEFLRRFCMHILPKRFVKIRRYGIYNHTTKRHLDVQFEPEPHPVDAQLKQKPKKETAQQVIKRLTGVDVQQCPFCRKGTMLVIKTIKPKIRSPNDLFYNQNVS
jgi:hypothetical protein